MIKVDFNWIAGYNPITGQAYTDDEDEKKRNIKQAEEEAKKAAEIQVNPASAKEIHTSTRVINPPGGRSTKLW